MSNSEFTKLMIAQGVKQLLESTPFAEVSVGQISKHCNISRNTFYYHFKDKYDIISWIFYTEITPIIGGHVAIEHWSDGLLSLCQYMQDNRKFYLNVLEFQGQNSFSECLMNFYQNIAQTILSSAEEQKVLTALQIRQVSRFYAHGLTGVILDWVQNGMSADPKPTINTLKRLLAGDIFNDILAIHKGNLDITRPPQPPTVT